ncbi:MAG: glycosyltransferase [Patescibacteria group bacterium]
MGKENGTKIKIAYILPTLDRGGAERFLSDLLLNLDQQTYDPTLILFKRGGDWLADLQAAGIRTLVLEKKYKFDPVNFWRLLAALRKIRPQIVHTQLGGDLYGRLATKILGVPVILSTEQNVNPDETRLTNILKKITTAWVDQVVAISQAVRTDLITRYRCDPLKIRVIPNGLVIHRFPLPAREETTGGGRADRSLNFGTLGRLVPQKGQGILIEALARLKNKDFRCLIAGTGPLKKQLAEQIEAVGLADKIELVGAISDPANFFKSLDIFILPSLWEGQGIVLLEAGLSGLPIIASAADGIAELITDETGWPIPAGDASALTEQIDWLAANLDQPIVKAKTEKLRAKIIASYDIKRIAALYQDLYQELLKRQGFSI